MKHVSGGSTRAVLILAALVALAGCGGSPAASPAATPTVTPTATATPTASPTIDYSKQYLADIAPWQAAIKRAAGSGTLTAPLARAAGRQAVATARRLLTQTWPASMESDIHSLAVAFDTLNEDIASDNVSKYDSDGTTLNADTNVVRAELDLPSIR